MNSLKEAIQSINTESATVLLGTVTDDDPLEIQMEGDEKYIISETVTAVPQHVGDLKKGDEVYVLQTDRGRNFFVLGRV